MLISFIVAVSENNAIGKNNTLPWHMPEDLKFFKRTTMGKPVIMGRKTFESMDKPLPGRLNVVLTTNKGYKAPEGVLVYNNINSAIEHLQQENVEESFIVGGGQIFAETMDLADRMFVTRIACTVPDADAFFPDIDHSHWKRVWQEPHEADDRHKYAYTFEQYDRIEL